MFNKIPDNPFEYFAKWFEEADDHKSIKEANAMNIATSTSEGKVSNRMVLLKNYDDRGFVFFTNLSSKKGQQIEQNKYASICFYWEPLSKQVRIEGVLEPVSEQEADDYFNSRPLKSRIGAWASKQSQDMESKAKFISEVAVQASKFVTEDVPRPPFWSGFRLVPHYMEFWKAGEFRIHDRDCYRREEGNPSAEWQHNLLYP